MLKVKHRLRAFIKRVPRKILVPKKEELAGDNYRMRSFVIHTRH